MKKRYILLAGIAVIAGGAYYVYNSLDAIVGKLVNKYGSEVLGTEVNLAGFSISPTKGTAEINRLTIANPKNYKEPYLFDLNKVAVKIDMKSLTSDTIIIDSIEVNKPAITYEMLSLTQNNIKEIQDNINNYLKKSSSGEQTKAKTETTEKAEASETGKKVIIKKLTISDIALTAAVAGQDATLNLPTIEMKNLGEEKTQTKTNIPQVIAKVMNKILSVAMDNVVSNKLNIPVEKLSRENISENLASHDVDSETIAKFISALDECEMARYAPGDPAGNMERTFNYAMTAITEIENVMKKRK